MYLDVLGAFLSWLSVTDLDHLEHGQGSVMVQDTLDGLRSDTEAENEELLTAALSDLQVIQADFLQGGVPAESLARFLELYKPFFTAEPEPIGVALEEELRDLADSLTEEEWCTESYLKLERGIQEFMDGDGGPLTRAIEEMEQLLEVAWSPYAETPVSEREVTVESAVGHQLLGEGVEEWVRALEQIKSIVPSAEPDWQEILDTAQYANRILVAVGLYSQRLQA